MSKETRPFSIQLFEILHFQDNAEVFTSDQSNLKKILEMVNKSFQGVLNSGGNREELIIPGQARLIFHQYNLQKSNEYCVVFKLCIMSVCDTNSKCMLAKEIRRVEKAILKKLFVWRKTCSMKVRSCMLTISILGCLQLNSSCRTKRTTVIVVHLDLIELRTKNTLWPNK